MSPVELSLLWRIDIAMARYLFALTLVSVVLVRSAGAAVECKAEAPSGRTEWWSWRLVDGKQCWYQGRPGKDKTEFYWQRVAPKPDRVEKVTPATDSNRELRAKQITPNRELPPFAERWRQMFEPVR
jgi:hypothetical protein